MGERQTFIFNCDYCGSPNQATKDLIDTEQNCWKCQSSIIVPPDTGIEGTPVQVAEEITIHDFEDLEQDPKLQETFVVAKKEEKPPSLTKFMFDYYTKPKEEPVIIEHEPESEFKNCPSCAEEIRYQAKKCKHCGDFQPGHEQKEEGGTATTAGTVCFLLGCIVMYTSKFLFFIYGPFIFISFILSIVVLAQGKTSEGLSLLIANIIFAPILFLMF